MRGLGEAPTVLLYNGPLLCGFNVAKGLRHYLENFHERGLSDVRQCMSQNPKEQLNANDRYYDISNHGGGWLIERNEP